MSLNLPAQPSSDPNWIIANPGNGTQPTNSQQNVGWTSNQRPPYQYMNWLFYNITLWIRWAQSSIVLLANATSSVDATIGTGGTYADINAAMADSGLAAGSTLLILNSLAFATTQQITKNNIQILMKPGVALTDNGAGTGIRISGTEVRIKGGKMSGFATQAILVDSGSVRSIIGELILASNTADITDNSNSGATYAIINQ